MFKFYYLHNEALENHISDWKRRGVGDLRTCYNKFTKVSKLQTKTHKVDSLPRKHNQCIQMCNLAVNEVGKNFDVQILVETT